jgi:putative transposase
MRFTLQPWQLLLTILAGLINRKLQEVIAYLRTENQVLKEAHGRNRSGSTTTSGGAWRSRVRSSAERFSARSVPASCPTPSCAGTGSWWPRSGITAIAASVLDVPESGRRLSNWSCEWPGRIRWGYDRIQGALADLGHKVPDSTIGNILRQHGIEPVPERKRQSTWKDFLEAHGDVLGAIDFTTIAVWTKSGLATFYLLFVMEVATRRIHFAGCTTSPDERWMKQLARNLTDNCGGPLLGTRYLLMDRDAKFSAAFRSILGDASVKSGRLPARSPNLNSHLERFMRSLKEERLDRMIFFGEASLRKATTEFLTHFHRERNHQGLGNQLIAAGEEVGRSTGHIQCRKRLGGMLRYYYRAAA